MYCIFFIECIFNAFYWKRSSISFMNPSLKNVIKTTMNCVVLNKARKKLPNAFSSFSYLRNIFLQVFSTWIIFLSQSVLKSFNIMVTTIVGVNIRKVWGTDPRTVRMVWGTRTPGVLYLRLLRRESFRIKAERQQIIPKKIVSIS